MDPKVVATVNEIPPPDSSAQEWIETLAEEAYGSGVVEYVANDSGGYDVVVK